MGYEELRVLSRSYSPQERVALYELAQKYRSRDEREVFEVAAIAGEVSLDDVINLGREPEGNPLFLEAFKLQYPNVDVKTLVGASEERLGGMSDGVKGKYFEVLVRDRLNDGERVGELQLGPGQTARLAESPTQSGWDLRIENEDGSTDELLQLKATESMGYVKEALVEYPGIRVVVPSEVDDHADEVVGTDIPNSELDNITRAQIGEMGEGAIEDLSDASAEIALDSIPFASMVATGVIEGRSVLTGRSTLRESFKRGAKRMRRVGVYNAIGALLAPTGVGVPVVMGMRVAEGRISKRIAFGDNLRPRTHQLERLTASDP